jgi:hypothetical protein
MAMSNLPDASAPGDPPASATPASEVPAGEVLSRAAEAPEPSLFMELVDFVVHNKAWWLTPIILVLSLVGLFLVLAGTGAGPFIYSFF